MLSVERQGGGKKFWNFFDVSGKKEFLLKLLVEKFS
jgi:hypothetical protein